MQGFDFDELLIRFRYPLLILLGGLILMSVGIFVFKSRPGLPGTKVEILPARNASQSDAGGERTFTVEIAGSVEKPGVYKLFPDARIAVTMLTQRVGTPGGFLNSYAYYFQMEPRMGPLWGPPDWLKYA